MSDEQPVAFSPLDLAASEIENYVGFKPVEEGEYMLAIDKMTCRRTNAGNPGMLVSFNLITENPEFNPGRIDDFFNLPYTDCKPKARKSFTDHLAGFRLCFGIGHNELTELIQSAFQTMQEQGAPEVEIADYQNVSGRVVLELDPDRVEQDPSNKNYGKKYRARNRIGRYII